MSAIESAAESLGARCLGLSPLTARLEPWQVDVCGDPDALADVISEHGSPVNLIDPRPMARNAAELSDAAREAGLTLELFFARKANKSLALVDEARRLGMGIDLASETELEQCLSREVPGSALMMTAAVKPLSLLQRCVEAGVTIAVDNRDELLAVRRVASARPARIALRLAPRATPHSRFGVPVAEAAEMARSIESMDEVTIEGVHFHVDGYRAADRVESLGEALELVDVLRASGHSPGWIDIGGGIPMRYLDSRDEWDAFWLAHRDGMLGAGESLTYGGHGLGLTAHAGELGGRAAVYPAWQQPLRGQWLAEILSARLDDHTVADHLRRRGLSMRAEPGRCLLDGAGLTAARVEYRKQRRDGTWLIGVAMNRTQCRSAADDFLVDPLLLSPRAEHRDPTGPIEGYLMGAYCIERELLTWRRMRFPQGVAVGDIVVFPNTAGYFMHILESPSHQTPLASNLVHRPGQALVRDPIDEPINA